jgi:hypothetical protein
LLEWRNWYTRYLEVVVSFNKTCRFKSCLQY